MAKDKVQQARAHLGQMRLNHRLAIKARVDAERELQVATNKAKDAADAVAKAKLDLHRAYHERDSK